MSVASAVAKWWLKRRLKREVRRIRKEATMLGKTLLLRFIPSGWLTVGAGWFSILNAIRCYFGIDVAGLECMPNPGEAMVSGLTGLGLIGLGRRGQ